MLSPEEIKSREFLVSLRGYDRDEVNAFLGRIAEEVAQAQVRANDLEQQVEQLRSTQQQAPAPTPEPAAATAQPTVFAEIGRETQRILEAAQEAGQQMQRRARQDADKELQTARSQAARNIAEGERRREQIEQVVRALDEARAALATDLRNVGRTIETTLRDLAPTETPSTSVRKAMETEARVAGERSTRGVEAAAAEAAPDAEAAPESDAEAEPAAEPELEPESPQAAEAGDAGEEPEITAAADTESASEEVAEEAPPLEMVAEEAAAEPTPEPTPEPEPERIAEEAPAAVEETPEPEPASEEVLAAAEPEPEPEPEPAAAEEAPAPEPEPEQEAVSATAPDASPPATQEQLTVADAAPAAVATAAAPRTGASRDPSGLRASALSPLHPKLVRKLKRELQEVQNIALDRVRRSGGRGEVDDFLPQGEDAAILGEGAAEFLEQAWSAGVAAASTLAEADLGDGGEAPELSGKFSDEATERLRASLGATLRMGMSAGEPPQALSDRIGSVFSELKGTSAEELSATHLIHAYETGLLGTWRFGGIKARSWVLGREPRCPEARCRQNDQTGPLPLDQEFPSGHDVPPVHVGCTCTTVPVLE